MRRMVVSCGILLGIFLFLPAAQAESSHWSAVLHASSEGTKKLTAKLWYGYHRLRIDHLHKRTIIDFERKTVVHIDTRRKIYASTTISELLALREERLNLLEKKLKLFPPTVRFQLEVDIRRAKQATSAQIRTQKTGRRESKNGVTCEFYTWRYGSTHGEACIATQLPFNLKALQADAAKLNSEIGTGGWGGALASSAIFQLLPWGLAIELDQQQTLGTQILNTHSAFKKIRRARHTLNDFEPPGSFQKRPLKAFGFEP